MTGKPEVISSSVGFVPTNVLAATTRNIRKRIDFLLPKYHPQQLETAHRAIKILLETCHYSDVSSAQNTGEGKPTMTPASQVSSKRRGGSAGEMQLFELSQ
jgi:hypothetical protein